MVRYYYREDFTRPTCAPASVRRSLLLWSAMEQLALDIRPEFLEDLRDGVDGELLAKLGKVVAWRALVGVVSVRDRHLRRIAKHFRKVEAPPSGIGARHKDSRQRVPGARPFGPMPPPEVARIFAQQGREDSLGHQVANRLISVGRPQPSRETSRALTERRMLFGQVPDAGQPVRQ